MPPCRRFPPVAILSIFGMLAAFTTPTIAQNLFVCLGDKDKLASVITIPPPEHGWIYSAVAPVRSETWNRVKRTTGIDVTDPLLATTPGTSATRLGIHFLDTADHIALVDSEGNPTAARPTVCLNLRGLATRDQATIAIFDYIESFYNRTRLHSALGLKSPLAHESNPN